jgi:SulP family sulfate permease
MPYPVTVGFTSGIALIIFTTQIADFLGLKLAHVPEHFWQKWAVYVFNFTHLNPYALVIGVIAVFVVIFCPKKIRHVPPPLIALVVSTAIVQGLGWPVETIGSRFGEVSNRFPPFQFPAVTWELIVKMSPAAMAIALLAGIESLLSAVVADGMIGTRHRSNTELIAQGIANIASPLWGGIPATGAIARTATNIKLGGRSPIAGIVHAVTILLIFLFLAPWAALIPMPALAGILIVVAYNMSEWQVFVKLFRSPKSDILVLLTTFLLTIFVDLTAAIEVGVVLAAFLFMRRMIAVTEIGFLRDDENDEGVARPKPPEGVEVFEINGPFFFGAADKFRDTMHQLEKPPHVLILLMRAVPAIDATGLRALEDLLRKAKKDRMAVVLCGVPPHPKEILYQSGVVEGVGKENVCDRLDDAINRAREIIGK